MTGAKKAHDELELMLSAVANGARRKSMAETKADLKAVRKELENFFDQLTAEVGKSSRSTFIKDSKERVLKRIAGSYSITHETPTERYSAPMRYPIVRCPKRNPILVNRFTRNFEREVI